MTDARLLPPSDARLVEMAHQARQIRLDMEVHNARWWALCRRDDDVSKEELDAVTGPLEPLTDRIYELWDEMQHLTATTLQGVAAKASLAVMRILHEHDGKNGLELDGMSWGERLAYEACRDVAKLGEGLTN